MTHASLPRPTRLTGFVRKLIGTVLGAAAGFAVGLALAIGFVGIAAGVLWLFVFGDNTWPESAESVLGAVAELIIAAGTLLGAYLGYRYARRHQPRGENA